MANPFSLEGKVAIVTGASRGIGQSIAKMYADNGASVVITSRKQDALDVVAMQIRSHGGEVTPIAAHNGDKNALKELVSKTVKSYGRIDILVNNAATNPHFGPILDSQDSMWQKTIEVNLMGNFWLTSSLCSCYA